MFVIGLYTHFFTFSFDKVIIQFHKFQLESFPVLTYAKIIGSIFNICFSNSTFDPIASLFSSDKTLPRSDLADASYRNSDGVVCFKFSISTNFLDIQTLFLWHAFLFVSAPFLNCKRDLPCFGYSFLQRLNFLTLGFLSNLQFYLSIFHEFVRVKN